MVKRNGHRGSKTPFTDECAMRAEVSARPAENALSDPDGEALWLRSRASWRFVLARFVPLLTAGSREILQLPFYTLWQEGTPRSRVLAVVLCTIGDALIGTAALLVSVILSGRYGWPRSRHRHVLATATFTGISYTVFSEWLNTQVTMSWQYAESMFRVPPLGTGIAPLLQWVIIPPLAYWLARASAPTVTESGATT